MSFQLNQLPFNLDILILGPNEIKGLHEIKVLDIFTASSDNFHPLGLFSTEIFGKVGEEKRNRLFAYIDLKVSVFHPILFKAICDLKELYANILSGKEYAKFDKNVKDFIKSDPIEGDTGFAFFCSHFNDLTFEQRPSAKREFNIKLINKYRETALLDKLLIMPAGLRDYEIDENNRPSEDEINTYYREVMSIASVIDNINVKNNEAYLDNARYSMQIKVSTIYNYIKNMLEGKNKFIQGKWGSRKVFNSTRNVITSYLHDSPTLFGDQSVSTTQTVVGLYQYLRAIFPLAAKHVRDNYLSDVFIGPNSPAILVNKKTLKKESVQIDPVYYDEWMTMEGLEKVFARYGQVDLRHDILEIGDHYLGLIYKGPDKTFKFIQDIDDVPEAYKKEDCHPMTFTELLYLSVFKDSNTIPALVTRYPITGYGSIYPSYLYLRTTIRSEVRTELDDNWDLTETKAVEFPISGEQFFESMGISGKHLARLTADHDGRQHCRL